MNAVNFDHRQGFQACPDSRSGPAGDKAPYIDHGTTAPDKSRYYSGEEMAL